MQEHGGQRYEREAARPEPRNVDRKRHQEEQNDAEEAEGEHPVAHRGVDRLHRLYVLLVRKEREPERMIEPLELYAPGLLVAYGKLEQATAKQNRVYWRLKMFAQLMAATLQRCEYCIDLGSQIARHSGLSDERLLTLPRSRENALFTHQEKLVLAYAAGMSSAPVDVSDDLFTELREHFDKAKLVELRSVIALENMCGRFNLALGFGAAGFSEGMVCAAPANTPDPTAQRSN